MLSQRQPLELLDEGPGLDLDVEGEDLAEAATPLLVLVLGIELQVLDVVEELLRVFLHDVVEPVGPLLSLHLLLQGDAGYAFGRRILR